MKIFLKKYLVLVLAALIAGLGICVMLYSTKNNPWGFTDSIAYLVSARNLVKGIGLGYHFPSGAFHYLTHYPPLYSLVISGFVLLGAPEIQAVRILVTSLFPATLLLIAIIFHRFGAHPYLGLAVLAALISFEPMLSWSASAMSEPLYIFLSVGTGITLLLFIGTGRFHWLIVSALCAAASTLTRYIGVTWIATGFIGILMLLPGDGRARIYKAMQYLVVSVLPVAIWFLWVYQFADRTVGGRMIALDLMDLFDRLEPFRGLVVLTLWKWLPFQSLVNIKYIWRVAALLALAVLTVGLSMAAASRLQRSRERASDHHIFAIFGIYSFLYLMLLAVFYAFSSPSPDIDDRMMLPLFVTSTISLYAGISLWIEAFGRKRWLAWIPWLLVLAAVWEYSPENYKTVLIRPDYAGLTSVYWQEDETVAEARKLPPDAKIISNQPEVMLMWADRPAHHFGGFSRDFIESDSFYGTDLNDPTQRLFREGNAFLVVTNDFYHTSLQSEGLTAERQVSLFKGLKIYKRLGEGTIYVFP